MATLVVENEPVVFSWEAEGVVHILSRHGRKITHLISNKQGFGKKLEVLDPENAILLIEKIGLDKPESVLHSGLSDLLLDILNEQSEGELFPSYDCGRRIVPQHTLEEEDERLSFALNSGRSEMQT